LGIGTLSRQEIVGRVLFAGQTRRLSFACHTLPPQTHLLHPRPSYVQGTEESTLCYSKQLCSKAGTEQQDSVLGGEALCVASCCMDCATWRGATLTTLQNLEGMIFCTFTGQAGNSKCRLGRLSGACWITRLHGLIRLTSCSHAYILSDSLSASDDSYTD